jgi:hypothetical protein
MLTALQDFGIFLVLSDGVLHSYSLDLLARSALGTAPQSALDGSRERLGDGSVTFFRAGMLGDRTIGMYTYCLLNPLFFAKCA